jgi:polar amino acid transport system substrate-binding protein
MNFRDDRLKVITQISRQATNTDLIMTSRRVFLKNLGAGALLTGGISIPLIGAAQPQPGTLKRVVSSGKLRIGAVTDGIPAFQKDIRSGEWRGIFIDVSRKLAQKNGLKLEIVETTWGNSVLDLQSGKIDLMFGLNPTPDRRKAIDFSTAVFQNGFTLVCRENAIFEKWEDYNKPGIRIAVDAGSSHDATVTRLLPKATIIRLDSVGEASIALQSGRADAQCLVMMLSLPAVKKNAQLGKVVAPMPVAYTTSHAGFAKAEDTDWQEFVDKWIKENRENGFIPEAILKNMSLVNVTPADFPAGIQL